MQFNGVNNKECWSYLACQWCCEMCMHQDPICLFSWIWVHCSMFKWVLNSVLAFLAFLDKFSEHLFSLVFHNCKDSVYNSFSLPSLFLSTDLLSVTGACFFLLYDMRWGLTTGLPGIASHGRDPLQGAGCP